jgi:hypothetical protein
MQPPILIVMIVGDGQLQQKTLNNCRGGHWNQWPIMRCVVKESKLWRLSPMRQNKRLKKIGSAAEAVRSEQFKLISKTCTQRRCRNGKLKLPKLPPNLSWPSKKYSKERRKRGVNIVEFLQEEWADLIEAGFGELRWLRLVDRSAARAIESYERGGKTGPRRRLPKKLRFLTEREVTDRKLALGWDALRVDPRLLQTIAGRLRRGLNVPIP